MSTKTFFKRMSLGVIAALGFGLLSTPTAQAVRLTNSLTLSSATGTATVFDSATVTLTLRQTSTQDGQDSMTVRVSCDGPTGETCPTLKGYQDATADTSNVNVGGTTGNGFTYRGIGAWTTLSGWSESQTLAASSMRSVISVKAVSFPAAGTYTYTIYATGNGGASDVITGTSTTWAVTVTSPSTNATLIVRQSLRVKSHHQTFRSVDQNRLRKVARPRSTVAHRTRKPLLCRRRLLAF